jgi:thioredoxin-like negative regulator of GroEL
MGTLRNALILPLLPLWLVACGDLREEEVASEAAESHGSEIAWFGGTIEEAFDLARNTARPVFLYWGAEWCPPCHYLKNKIFKRPEFVAKIEEFIPVYLDGDSERAQVLGEELDVQGYPTVIVFNPEGEEVIRMPSTIPVAQYADILDAALQIRRPIEETLSRVMDSGVADAERADLSLLAFYSWDQDSKTGLSGEEKIAVLRRLHHETPTDLELQRSRFLTLYLRTLIEAAAGESEDITLSADERSEHSRQMIGILSDPDLRRANLLHLLYGSRETVELLHPEPSAAREALVDAWKKAARACESDETLSLDDRLSSLIPRLALARLAAEENLPQGDHTDDSPLELPPELIAEVRDRVAVAASQVADEGELQTVLSTMVWLLQTAGLDDEAETLLAEKMEQTAAPYYYMSRLASLKQDAEQPNEALLWYRKAYDSARGRYTRFRWGSIYLRRLLELAPSDLATIEAASMRILDELLTHEDAFALGNYSRLGSLEEAYRTWGENGGDQELLATIRQHVHTQCDRYPDDGEDSQRQRCLAFLAS